MNVYSQWNSVLSLPVCSILGVFINICRLTGYSLVTEILSKTPDATEVELARDGSWRVTREEDRDCDTPDPCMAPKQPPVVENVIQGSFVFM